MTHPAADLLRAIADGKPVEFFYDQKWSPCTAEQAFARLVYGEHSHVRIAREIVTRTVTYPAPLREKPKRGDSYFYTDAINGVSEMEWEDDELDNAIFSAGMAFATREDAEAAHKALFGGGV